MDVFNHPDYYLLDELLSDEHKMIRDATREWVKKSVSPIIEDYAQRAAFPEHLVKEMGEIGLFGPYVPEEYGGAGLDHISYGLMMQEVERGDSGIRSTCSVQSSLVMFPILAYGSEEQKRKFLPKLATGEFLGSFGLTEPNFGSNPGGMTTNYKDMGDHYLLNGAKMWISNSPFCHVAVVWAKNEEGRIHGLIVERGMEGFTTPETHNKWSLRASATGELVFDTVQVKVCVTDKVTREVVHSCIYRVDVVLSIKICRSCRNNHILIFNDNGRKWNDFAGTLVLHCSFDGTWTRLTEADRYE